MKTAIAVIIAVIIVGGGGYVLVNHNNDNSSDKLTTASKSDQEPKADESQAAGNSQATGTIFTINANDESADLTTLNVKKGDKITVTFKVDTNNVYHGGLEFKSDVVSSKAIKPGDSDTVTFTADKSFDFTPYWYQSGVKKDYLISVKVQ